MATKFGIETEYVLPVYAIPYKRLVYWKESCIVCHAGRIGVWDHIVAWIMLSPLLNACTA